MKTNASKKLYEKGSKYLVGAVNSPVRAFKAVGGNPIFIKKAKGSKITDVDGNKYIDYVGSYGPMILGHGNSRVLSKVNSATKKGFSFGASTLGEIKLAELIVDTFPGIDKVRFVNSGTEAVLSAIRLARAFTGKNKIIKFAGCYHGHSDSLLVAGGSGIVTLGLPGCPGVPEDTVKDTLVALYNNIESVKTLISQNESQIAAVFIEPVAGNMGVVIPDATFIKELRKITKENGILLVVDEVMTGFRSKFGGAQDLLGIQADISCLGKVIGGGFPVGAYGAREEIMNRVAPLGDVYQAGTLSGNPVAMAAGYATLKELQAQNPYENFERQAKMLEEGILASAKKHGLDVQVNRFGSMINPFFSKKEIKNFEDAQNCDQQKFSVFFWELMKGGIFIPPSQFEAWFLSTAHSDNDIKRTIKVIDSAYEKISQAK